HRCVLTKIEIGKEEERFLNRRGYTPQSVPEKDEKVFLRIGGNLSQGGTSVDWTEKVDPKIKWIIEKASKAIGLDIIGIDVISEDLTCTPSETTWDIIEVNASPGLRMHTDPCSGESRDVGEKIIEGLYPSGNGRIPVVAVTGTNGKTTTSRIIDWISRKAGHHTGLAVTGGIYSNGELVTEGDTTGPWSAGVVLNDKDIDFAVLETARGGILRRGLGFDKCDVSVLTNIREDHLGIDGLESLEDIFRVKSVILEATDEDGACVINANDDFAEKAMEKARGLPVLFGYETNELMREYRKIGGIVFTVDAEKLIMYEEGKRKEIMEINEIPFIIGDVKMLLEDALAASAAAYSSGISTDLIREGLKTFEMNSEMNPGRLNTYDYNGSKIILDYAHNVDGLEALGEFIDAVPGERTIASFTVPGDREDDFIMQCGRESARWFDVLVCTENPRVMRGRENGEIAEMLARGVGRDGGKVPITIPNRERAIRFLLENSKNYDKLVIADLDIDEEELMSFISRFEDKKNN
ncbi:MAG: cyanophycin synthetase, partial [Candidatus Thermoplasmatota archaeon]|nr:cyanophycin synthetase [Candidatus Thermoplasmatota archaeon]